MKNPPAATAPIIKCAGNAHVGRLAGSIAHALRGGGRAELHAIGPNAVNQAIKASAAACAFLAQEGCRLIMWPEFFEAVAGDSRLTGIALHYELTRGVENEN